MSRNLLDSAKTYLAGASEVRVAHLIQLELATGGTFDYLTDYQRDVVWDSKTFAAGKINKVSDVRQTQGLTNYKLTVEVAGEFQEELDRGLSENLTTSYTGKNIIVHRAYLAEDGSIIDFDGGADGVTPNGPMEYFVGEITDIKIEEGVTTGTSKVSWTCAGKFQDFEKINGRLTDDKSHRALVSDGLEEVPSNSVKKPIYGLLPGQSVTGTPALDKFNGDLGFMHSGQAIGLISKYMVTETRYKLKKSWGGLKSKLKAYDVEVEKTVELGFELEAKALPVIYGVRKITGIPVFIDTVKNDPSKIYIVYAFCEGEIDAFLNIYIGGESVIGLTAADEGLGSQRNGDTLSKFQDSDSETELEERYESLRGRLDEEEAGYFIPRFPPATPRDPTEGSSHEDIMYVMSDSGNKWLQFFHGKPDQDACQALVGTALINNFTVQQGTPGAEYWGAGHRLLDTAYIVMQISISESEQEIPTVDAVISGKDVDIYTDLNTKTTGYTLNPSWHALDYMTNKVYGGGVDIAGIDINSFINVAAELGTLSTEYDSSFIKYWRYIGWKIAPPDNSQLAVMQCNVELKTEKTVTKNINGLLEQFEGTVNALGSSYHISLENADTPLADLSMDDVIGTLVTKDLSGKDKWNSINASILDPGLDWKSNQINFFHDVFLTQDNDIPKQGRISFQHITNYYTARAWAERELRKSRFARQLIFTTYYKYLFLFPNANVTFTYDRFGYDKKLFRVVSTTLKSNGLVDLVLEDFDASIYTESPQAEIPEDIEPNTRVTLPQNLTFTKLPDANFPSLAEDMEGVHGILHWDPAEIPNILRYEVRDWHEVTDVHTTVSINKTVTDNVSRVWHYHLITDLNVIQEYRFKVLTVGSDGMLSNYAVVKYNNTDVEPVLFEPVTGLTSNAINGVWVGPDLTITWDAHTNPGVTQYNVEILDSGNVTLVTGVTSTGSEMFTFTLAANKTAYNTQNASLGAYREVKARVQATDGSITSEWTELI